MVDRHGAKGAKLLGKDEARRRMSLSCQAFFKMLSLCLQSGRNFVMQTTTKIILAVCSIGAVAIDTLKPANAYFWPPAGGFRYDHHLTWDGCPPGFTVQRDATGEYCARCKGPGGGFLNGYWNGCPPPGYSVREIRRRGGYDVFPRANR